MQYHWWTLLRRMTSYWIHRWAWAMAMCTSTYNRCCGIRRAHLIDRSGGNASPTGKSILLRINCNIFCVHKYFHSSSSVGHIYFCNRIGDRYFCMQVELDFWWNFFVNIYVKNKCFFCEVVLYLKTRVCAVSLYLAICLPTTSNMLLHNE